jgi:exodeoxyribonuclease VII large subunit
MVEPVGRIVWDVASLLAGVGDALTARFGACAVRGELASVVRAASGHCYFSLKDAQGGSALLRCAMFKRAAALLDFQLADGQLVELRGRLCVYEPRGELQLVVEAMRPAGAGALYEQFLRLKARLEADGLFDAASKRVLPTHPSSIGVVTSLGAAALHDVLSVLSRRAPHLPVVVYPSPVQGPEAAPGLARAIALAGERREVDLLILCRGGGALQDLWAFNDERVVRAIAASTLPIVCGVGHETDVTLADLAADLRAPTPTGAAELAAPPRDALLRDLEALAQRLQRTRAHRWQTMAQRLDRAAAALARPTERLARERSLLDACGLGLARAAAALLAARRRNAAQLALRAAHAGELQRSRLLHRTEQLATRLSALDPQQIISRGYALVQTVDGELVVDPAAIHAGSALRLTLKRGQAEVLLARAVELNRA